ncbi:hypothetical protein JRQ81_004270 [Phrynocephalus forsythii]|uniref:C-type lectin domain-containing protein n=1 Tax=Phrynocephalus forsythii TaxID=171643 RepID=A0A9Q0XFM8_9SAUR|nr:hypothetical protein JRQ81_004270 [Phrynocephalus forsythii]
MSSHFTRAEESRRCLSCSQQQVNQKMALFTNFALCLLGIVFSNPFLGVEADTCPRDWLQNQGNCYAFFNEPLTWEEAEAECQSYGRGTHLASILTKAEALLVARYISSYQPRPSTVWIGLHDVRQNGRWRWADESAYNYKAWLPGEPNNTDGDEYCAELWSSTAKADTCASRDWLQNQGNCYAYFDEQLSWAEAENRRWRWSDGSVYSYKAWNLGQPNNIRKSQYCVELMASTGLKEWNDITCHTLNAYICKHEL